MKGLKLKFPFFCLLLIISVSIFITSCEQSEITETLQESSIEMDTNDLLLMPYGFDNLSEELQIEYFQNLTKEGFEELKENHRVGSFLQSIGQLETVTTELMSEGLLLTKIDLNEVLSSEETVQLTSYQYDDIDFRGYCFWWSFYYSYYHPVNCWGPNCCVWNVFKRTCLGMFESYTEYMHVNNCQ